MPFHSASWRLLGTQFITPHEKPKRQMRCALVSGLAASMMLAKVIPWASARPPRASAGEAGVISTPARPTPFSSSFWTTRPPIEWPTSTGAAPVSASSALAAASMSAM